MGIKAEDLRRGNLLIFDGRIVKVSVIGSDYLGVKDGHKISSLDYSWLKPISLTEENLIIYGFEEEVNSKFVKFWRKSGITIFHRYDLSPNEFELSGFDLKIKHLNQLQNLYYALTNTELTIK